MGKYQDAECRVSNPEAPDLIMTIVEKQIILQECANKVGPLGESPLAEAMNSLMAEADQHIGLQLREHDHPVVTR